jgi:mono/diheme cytochrome c family protein
MRTNQLKIFIIAITTIPLLLLMLLNVDTNVVKAVSNDDEATVKLYKTKCAACHKGDATKFYDPEVALEEQVEIILKGKKGDKPPFMPGYENKGIDKDTATALANYMKGLRVPEDTQETDSITDKTGETVAQVDDATINLYKTKCAACHKGDASKFYDPEMALEEQVEIILKGKKGDKPPFMPGYENKGIDNEKATGLANYMKILRTPESE